ncbi:MAG: RluA family pseudouridine synthase [Bacteroidales bacterium]
MNFTSDRILYEDNHYLAVDKYCGDIVQADKTGDVSLLEMVKQYLKERDAKPGNIFLEVTHRIDRPVSGAILFAKTSKGLSRMNNMFQEGKIGKKYWAVTKKRPPLDTDLLVHYLIRDSKKNKSFVYGREVHGSKVARLRYTIVGKTKSFFLLEIELITGRHHQIRSQLSKVGCPVKGDLKYGYDRSNPDGGIHLHSRSLSFVHPITDEQVKIVSNPPKDPVWEEFMALGI